MNISESKHKNYGIGTIIASIWLIFCSMIIIRAFNDSLLLDGVSGRRNIDKYTDIANKTMEIKRTIKADEAIQKKEYEKALALSSGNKVTDYYNRGVIQTLLAYDNALHETLSWIDHARILLAQAQKNFDAAGRLSDSVSISEAVIKNQNTIDSLSTVVDIKSCYGIWQNSIIGLNWIMTTIYKTKDTLNQERWYLDQKSWMLPDNCRERLTKIVDMSYAQISSLWSQIQSNITEYRHAISERMTDPSICIDTPFNNIIPSISKAKEWLDGYHEQHINTVEALKSDDNEIISQLCDQSKNDAQINQGIDEALQELFQKLKEKTWENNEMTKNTNKEEYKDFFNQEEKKALEEINTTNKSRIEKILDIRGKGNYDAERYINEIFNGFYGNSGDFINLHK